MHRLEEIEAIKQLKYKYLRSLDQKLWDEMAECFVEDATSSYSGGKFAFSSRKEVLDFFRKSMGGANVLSSHRVHHPEIELTSDTTATGIWALEDTYIDAKAGFTVRGAAFYRDDYVKVDGAWKIQHTGYERSYEEMETRGEMPWLKITQGWPPAG